jgi:hypothetical protein
MNVSAAQNPNVSDQVVNRILARLKTEQPKIYAEILRRYKPIAQLSGLGDLSTDFAAAFSSVLGAAKDLYVTKEQADIASNSAKAVANQELQKGQQQLEAMRLNAQNQYTQMQYAAEQQRLDQIQKQMDSEDRNKMLLMAAAGLTGLLVFSMVLRKK